MSEVERTAPNETTGVFTVVLVFVCCDNIGVVLKFELPIANRDAVVAGARRNKNASDKDVSQR